MKDQVSEVGVPSSPEGITPEWLTAALRAGGGGGDPTVTAVTIDPIGVGVGLMSLLFRVTPRYGSGNGPTTLVAKVAPPYPQVREIAAGYGFYGREVLVYQELGPDLGLRPPDLYFARHDPETDDFVILMEDLSHLRCADQLTGCSIDDARTVVTELARHHAAWWRDPRLDHLPYVQDWSQPPYPQYNGHAGKDAWPIIEERFGHLIPDRIRVLGDAWGDVGPALMQNFGDGAVTLTHGDVRLDNIFFDDRDDEPLSILDWQIAGRGPGATDLGYFMSQSLAVDDRRRYEDELTRRYHDELLAGGVTDYPFAEFWDDYRRAVLFCLCYPLQGGAVELVNDRAVALATAMLERSLNAIIDLDADQLRADLA